MKHLLSDFDLSRDEVHEILKLSERIKRNPEKYGDSLNGKTLVMLFELASLRTRISFEAGMNRLGGHAIFYSIEGASPGARPSRTGSRTSTSTWTASWPGC